MEEEKKKTTFCLYFRHISPCFYSNFDWERSLDAELNSASNEYPLNILLTDPATPKTRNTVKNMMTTYLLVFLLKFWSRELVGCRIKFRIQWVLPMEIWVKKQGDMLKMQTKKIVFFMIPIPKFILIFFKTYTIFQI